MSLIYKIAGIDGEIQELVHESKLPELNKLLDKSSALFRERIVELEKERDDLKSEFSQASKLEQQAKGVSQVQILLQGNDWEDDELQLTLASRSIELNIKAEVLKEQVR